MIDVFRLRNWESGSANRDVQLRALIVTHCRCPGTELDEGGHSQVRSTAAQPSLISAYARLAPQMGEGFAALDAALSPYRTGNFTDGFYIDIWRVSMQIPLAHVPPRGGTLTELANFDNDERNVIHERAVSPRCHPVKDCLPHFRQWKRCRIED